MTEKEFRTLIQKYLLGKTSNLENTAIQEFIEKMENYDGPKLETGPTDRMKRLKEESWEKLEEEMFRTQNFWSRKTIFNITKVAALLLIMVSTALIFWNSNKGDERILIPKDAITLELDDGTKVIIDESAQQDVLDINGNVVGKQNGTEMQYVSNNPEKELRYNKLTVPYGKKFDLTLSDGTAVKLNSGTSLKYPVEFIAGVDRKVFVTGEAYMQVAKDSVHPFLVSLQGNMVIEVLGTEFNVLAHPEDDVSEVVLVEGSIGLSTKSPATNESTELFLNPGQMASFNKQSKDFKTKEVITDVYTAWVKGELIFRNMTFENIMKKLERHYDVKITNRNTGISQEKYDASFREVPIQSILNNFRDHYGISYEITGNQIIIN